MTYELPPRLPHGIPAAPRWTSRRPEAPREVISASLPELVAQAVENERTKLLNELRKQITAIEVRDRERGYWEDSRSRIEVRNAAIAIIDKAYDR